MQRLCHSDTVSFIWVLDDGSRVYLGEKYGRVHVRPDGTKTDLAPHDGRHRRGIDPILDSIMDAEESGAHTDRPMTRAEETLCDTVLG